MKRFVALYRGVNVGRKTSVKMEALRAMHERLGHGDVRNYIQSGNLIFAAKGAAEGIAGRIAAEFVKSFGFPAKIMVLESEHWEEIVAASPYAKLAAANPKTVHLAICQGEPNREALKALLARTGGRETFEIKNEAMYLHAPDGFGTSKFAAGMEKAAGVPMTVRNWRTVEAVCTMCNGNLA